MPVCVTGMHRSGTSMIAKLLHEAGTWFGDDADLMPADAYNEDGYWEHVRFVAINDQILNACGAAWDCPPGPEVDWARVCALPPVRAQAETLLARFATAEPWGWKDPRTSVTLPFWRALCPDLKVIVCVRNPLEVAVSLRRRSGASYAFGIGLWTTYNRRLLDAVDPDRALVVHYASVLADPRREIHRMAEFLQLEWSAATIAAASASAQARLRHNCFTMPDLRRASVAADVSELYARLCGLADWHDGPEAPDGEVDDGGRADSAAALDTTMLDAALLRHELRGPWAEVSASDTRTRDLQAGIVRRESAIATLEERLTSRDRDVERLRSENRRLDVVAADERIRRLQLEARVAGRRSYVPQRLRRALATKRTTRHAVRALRRWGLTQYDALRRHGKTLKAMIRQPGARAAFGIPSSAVAAQAAAYRDTLAAALGATRPEYVPIREQFAAEDAAVKVIAFYLPQFHPIPENHLWWGEGFTDWTNVSKAVPQFDGHYQPHLPGELGFYDLRVPEVQRRQVELARQYGIFGFCFYYYWFAGRRLLDRPLSQFLSDALIDFPFCVCWANENWTRRWDGMDDEVLVRQEHSAATDEEFIRDIAPILRHRNYIRLHGRPVLVVYRAKLFADPVATTRRWREYCQANGLGDPYLIAAQFYESSDPRDLGFDAAVEFPPNTSEDRPDITRDLTLTNPEYAGTVYRYTDLMSLRAGRGRPPYPLFRTVSPAWDNEPRRPARGSTFAFSTPAAYGRWLDDACRFALADADSDAHVVFVNAWNEWAEGAHLEPDRRFGYAYLQQTADVIRSLRTPPVGAWTVLFVSHDAHRGGSQLALLNLLQWLRRHTSIRIKLLCLESGIWLPRFQEIADTILWRDVERSAAAASEPGLPGVLREFCGGSPDLIYGNSAASGRVYRALSELDVPILTHVHELESSLVRYAGDWLPDVFDHSRHYVSCSNAVRDNLVSAHHIASDSISTVYGSVSTESDVPPLADRERAVERQRLGLSRGTHLVFGCGIGMPFRKGADLFLQIASSVQQAGRDDVHFYWVGEFKAHESDPQYGVWGDYLAALRTAESPNVTFLGVQGDAKPYLRTGDVFLLSSREDPFPIAALEAAQCGLPILCFANSGGAQEFVDGDTGDVVPAGDVAAMAQRIVALIDDQPRRRAMAARSREKILTRHTVEQTAPQILSVCRTVARKTPAVSVIVPHYNHARYLERRLDSIFNQTFRDLEVILLDDASTDGSQHVLEKYRDRADVRIVRNDTNSGSTFRQWLKGLDLARADIVWMAESDDRCEHDFLETLLPAFQDPAVKLAYANSQVIDESDRVVGDYVATDYLVALSTTKWMRSYQVDAEQEINEGLGVKNTILSASSALWRRFDLTPAVRAALEELRIAGDWYCYIHAIENGKVHYSSRTLNYHRRHDESVVGALLEQGRAKELFDEFSRVHDVICAKYRLADDFVDKWERSLRDHWGLFFPDRPFEQIAAWYPLDRIRARIADASASPAHH